MIRRLIALLLVLGLGMSSRAALAAPRRVLVLPVGGTADAATRTRLSASLQRMARVIDGDVQAGDATFTDTATAIGCDPLAPRCVENVRATLGVDELVYGTADADGDDITLVVKRYRKGKQVREAELELSADDPPQKVEIELLPVFSTEPMIDAPDSDPRPDPDPVPDPIVPPDGGPVLGPDGNPLPEQPEAPSRRERTIAIAITAGGGVMFLLGLSLWSSKAGLQDDIDSHPTNTVADFERIAELEDRASSRGWAGNIFVLAGLAVGAYGGWRLYKDHQAHRSVTVTPVPTEGGAALVLTIGGGL